MTTQLNFSAAANPLSALVGAGLSDAKAAPAGGDSAGSGRFAELFTGHMLKLERQGLAAAQDGLGGLQMMPLGQTINVITSDAPVPDIQSLLAFAKAQGLDDSAVAGLFGEIPGVPQGVPMPTLLPQGVQVPSLLTEGVAAIGQSSDASAAAKASETLAYSPQATTLAQLQTLPGVTILGLQVAPKQPVDGAVASAPAPTSADNTLRPQDAIPVGMVSALALAAAQPLVPAVQGAEATAAASAEASPPMLDALRVQMGIPGEAITRRLAQMSGSKTSLSWAELVARAAAKADAGSRAGAGVPMSTASAAGAGPDAALALAPLPGVLSAASAGSAQAAASDVAIRLAAGEGGEAAALRDLLPAKAMAGPQATAHVDDAALLELEEELLVIDVPAGLDLGPLAEHASAPAAESGGPRQGSAPAAAPTPQAAADAARTAMEERAEQTRLLADRMGQALANRLIGQIERGQWKLQMRMQPEALGRVEVALDMHAGGLDAVFRTDNALTQDLLGQGAQRLRDALSQSGTTVASVTVHADARGQSGGNSTPQKRQSAPKQSAAPAAVAAVPHKVARYTGGVAEGLNVLA